MARSSNFVSIFNDQKGWRSCLGRLFPAASLFFIVLLTWSIWIAQHNKEKPLTWTLHGNISNFSTCENECRLPGSETLPKGIIAKTSNFESRPLWGSPKETNTSKYLFAGAVGMKQKQNVDKMVQKFLGSNFVVLLFHYDGIVDGWKEFQWSNRVLHVSADNQTKWWFAKRFLHPDIVEQYEYIFLWDEDLGVENFDPERYLSIVKSEGFEISQPALEIEQSEVHHLITGRGRRSTVHRRTYKHGDTGILCDENSSAPPCTGWIEVMAPVFSKAAWRCVWYMIQNDLIHAWGLDMKLGYCAQGDRTKNIGVVDAEYIVHYGVPTLGAPDKTKLAHTTPEEQSSKHKTNNNRIEVRRQSYNEYKVFKRRWKKAAEEDDCWTDLYPDDDQLIQSSL